MWNSPLGFYPSKCLLFLNNNKTRFILKLHVPLLWNPTCLNYPISIPLHYGIAYPPTPLALGLPELGHFPTFCKYFTLLGITSTHPNQGHEQFLEINTTPQLSTLANKGHPSLSTLCIELGVAFPEKEDKNTSNMRFCTGLFHIHNFTRSFYIFSSRLTITWVYYTLIPISCMLLF